MITTMTRRTALKTTLATAASWARVAGANERMNVAVIGLGGRGTWLLQLVNKHKSAHDDVEVVALCDVYRKRLSHAATLAPGARTYVHHQELLAAGKLDAVFIATPDHWHAPITLEALSRGIDVYVEKPMTHTVEEAAQVAARSCRDETRGPGRRTGNILEPLASDSGTGLGW